MNATAPSEPQSSAPSDPVRTAPLALWRIAEALLRMLHALFGAPERVAAQHTLTAKAHAQLASWLRSAEAMLRRLLLIEAAAYAKPNTRPLLRPAKKRTPKLMSFSPEAPEKWRVSFRCFCRPARKRTRPSPPPAPPATHAEPVFVFREDRRPRAKAPPRPRRARRSGKAEARPRILRQDRLWVMHEPKLRFRSAWPLAERYEALIRVFNDPTAYARRLAARLHATPHRLGEPLRAPPEAAARVDRFGEMGERAGAVWRRRFSSA